MQVQLKSVEHAQDPWYGVKCVGWSSKPRGTCCLGKGGLPHHLLGTSYHIIYSTPLYVLLPCHHIPSCPIFPDPSKSCWSLAWWCEIVSFVFNSLQTHLVFSSDLPIKSNKYGNQDEAIAIEHILMALYGESQLALRHFAVLYPLQKPTCSLRSLEKLIPKETDFLATESSPPWN